MATKQIIALPNATEAKDNDILLKRDTSSSVDQKLELPVLLKRVPEYLGDPVESIRRVEGYEPSLDMHFVDASAVPPFMNFERNSIGSYYDRDGLLKYAIPGEPRVTFDPTTKNPLGLLMEEERTNLVTFSEDFNRWNDFNITPFSSDIASPSGSLNVQKLVSDLGVQYATRRIGLGSLADNTIVTYSAYGKAGEFDGLRLAIRRKDSNISSATLSLTTGGIGQNSGIISHSVKKLPNGWYRFSITVNVITGASNPEAYIYATQTADVGIAGDGVSGLYAWGAQVEVSEYTTSYIPTNGAAVKRNFDKALFQGAAFTDWYNQQVGTIFVEMEEVIDPGDLFIATFRDSTNQQRIDIRTTNQGTRWNAAAVYDAVLQGYLGSTAQTSISKTFAFSYGNGIGAGASKDGFTEDLTWPIRDFDRMHFGVNSIYVTDSSMVIKRFIYWPVKISNELLINITRY